MEVTGGEVEVGCGRWRGRGYGGEVARWSERWRGGCEEVEGEVEVDMDAMSGAKSGWVRSGRESENSRVKSGRVERWRCSGDLRMKREVEREEEDGVDEVEENSKGRG